MTVAMCLPLLTSVLLGVFTPWVGRRLPPATAVRLLTTAMLLTALTTGFVLTVADVLVLAQIPVVAALGHWSIRVLGSGLPIPVAVGSLAVVTVCGLMAAVLRRAAVSGRALLRAAVACRRLGPSVAGLVVVDDDQPDAYALPGFSGRVVVSTGMLRALPTGERRVLLAHEAAHLRHRHHLWVQAAELAPAADPLLYRAARTIRAAVERWADEVAAARGGRPGSRPGRSCPCRGPSQDAGIRGRAGRRRRGGGRPGPSAPVGIAAAAPGAGRSPGRPHAGDGGGCRPSPAGTPRPVSRLRRAPTQPSGDGAPSANYYCGK